MQSVSLDILCLFPMSLNDDIIDIEKPYRIYLLTFVVDDFSELFFTFVSLYN